MNVQKTINKIANSIKGYVNQAGKESIFIATELARPTAPDNRRIAVIYYAVQMGITIEWAVKSSKAYKAEGWKGVAKQYVWSSAKSMAMEHYTRRAAVEIMETNTKSAEAAKEKEDTFPSLYEFNTEREKVIENAIAGGETSL